MSGYFAMRRSGVPGQRRRAKPGPSLGARCPGDFRLGHLLGRAGERETKAPLLRSSSTDGL